MTFVKFILYNSWNFNLRLIRHTSLDRFVAIDYRPVMVWFPALFLDFWQRQSCHWVRPKIEVSWNLGHRSSPIYFALPLWGWSVESQWLEFQKSQACNHFPPFPASLGCPSLIFYGKSQNGLLEQKLYWYSQNDWSHSIITRFLRTNSLPKLIDQYLINFGLK